MAYLLRGDYETTRALARKAAELDPTYFSSVMLQGWIAVEMGEPAEAIPWFEEAEEMGAPAFVTAWLAYARGASGGHAGAKSALEKLKRISLHGQGSPFNLALVSLGRGDHARAVSYLEQARQAKSEWQGWLKLDRVFDLLRSNPRFRTLLRAIGFSE